MNVLVYSGPGVSQASLTHTLGSLRALLLPHFAVQTISPKALSSEPWSKTCALLVIPGGRDIPYASSLAAANAAILAYVEGGGAFLGICAGAYYASKRVEWEIGSKLEVVGDRPLAFYPGTSVGCVYPGFEYESENGARAIELEAETVQGQFDHFNGLYINGGGEFLDAHLWEGKGVRVIARYTDEGTAGKAAAVQCTVKAGVAVLWHVHLEYPLDQEPNRSALNRRVLHMSSSELQRAEGQRWELLRSTLNRLGLRLPAETAKQPVSPLPQFLTAIPSKETITSQIIAALSHHLSKDRPQILHDGNDTFHFHTPSPEALSLVKEARSSSHAEGDISVPKHILVCDGLPNKNQTPLFDLEQYYLALSQAQESPQIGEPWRIGEALLYGEVVTSTQTMLDKNPILLGSLPTPILSLATFQLQGRGRGANAWVSPLGCLQFSLLVRPPLGFPAARLVFLQYLFGLAVVEACRKVLGSAGQRVRLKWPNDIYAIIDGDQGEERRKIGGVLVSTSFTGSQVDIVIGCGLNVLNPHPTTSLAGLLPPGTSNSSLTMERVAATIMATFEQMWMAFIADKGSFDQFTDLYLERWLHSDQLVTLETTTPPTQVRIVGITPDHGLLRTIPEATGGKAWSFIDLQPDGNSFDLMAGLIRTKR